MNGSVRPWAVSDLAVLTGREAAAFDAWAIREMDVPEVALMERAGSGAARLAQELWPDGPVLVLAGKGNNGGDALVAARCLYHWGRGVHVLSTAEGPADFPLLHGAPVAVTSTGSMDDAQLVRFIGERTAAPGLIVDGLLGTGIEGVPRGEAARVIRALATAREAGERADVLALDIPSGVDSNTGAAGGDVVEADLTVSFGQPKLGTLLHPGRAKAGRVVVLEIGFPPLPPERGPNRLLTPAWACRHRPERPPVTHKNRVGALTVVAGRPGMAGAAVLAARSALRCGAGYVRVVTHEKNREIVQTALPEAVFVDAADADAVSTALEASRAVAVGPAIGTDEQAAALLARVLESPLPRVVDADALTLLAGAPEMSRALRRDGTVVTPHPGEAARLLGDRGAEIEGDPLATLAALREVTGAVVVLKGAPSLVAGPDRMWIDTVGSSDLAVAGMGDTLTGAIGAFLAQGVVASHAAGLGLVTTGRAAARAALGAGLQAADVPDEIPHVLAEGPGERRLTLAGVLLDLDPAR